MRKADRRQDDLNGHGTQLPRNPVKHSRLLHYFGGIFLREFLVHDERAGPVGERLLNEHFHLLPRQFPEPGSDPRHRNRLHAIPIGERSHRRERRFDRRISGATVPAFLLRGEVEHGRLLGFLPEERGTQDKFGRCGFALSAIFGVHLGVAFTK